MVETLLTVMVHPVVTLYVPMVVPVLLPHHLLASTAHAQTITMVTDVNIQ